MEAMWIDDSPHVRFWRELLNSRVDSLVSSPDWLRGLRYDHKAVKWWQKRCGHIFEERGLNLYHLIAEANGECWDEEDEQKHAHIPAEKNVPPLKRKEEKPRQTHNAICLDHPRKERVRRQEEEKFGLHLRPGNERRQVDLQARREDFYRRAGGCS